jgi:nitric oxide reductase large subunit
LWVEGFFEVFATIGIAFFFMRLGLIRPGIAAAAARLLSATIFLSRGIIGTCHRLYFPGTPTMQMLRWLRVPGDTFSWARSPSFNSWLVSRRGIRFARNLPRSEFKTLVP